MSGSLDWKEAAAAICGAVEAQAATAFRKASDDVYEGLMLSVQTYLRDNVDFNLSSHLHSLREAARRAHERAESAERHNRDLMEAAGLARAFLAYQGDDATDFAATLDEKLAKALGQDALALVSGLSLSTTQDALGVLKVGL